MPPNGTKPPSANGRLFVFGTAGAFEVAMVCCLTS